MSIKDLLLRLGTGSGRRNEQTATRRRSGRDAACARWIAGRSLVMGPRGDRMLLYHFRVWGLPLV